MIVIAIIFYYLVITLILIISINYLGRWLRKYIEKRIDEGLTLLEKLEDINDELDTKINNVKIKIYDMYLDRCKESLRKKRKMEREYRELTQKVREKMKYKQGTFGRFFWVVGPASAGNPPDMNFF